MARESKAEFDIRETITRHLSPGETLREFTWGAKNSNSVAFFFFGYIGAALARQDQPGYFIGLTDKRLILIETRGKTPTGGIYNIPVADIVGINYNRGPYSGTLNVHLTTDTLALNFDSRPWYPRAQNMAKLMPIKQGEGDIHMDQPMTDSQSLAQSFIEKAETYKKLGLKAQVQDELEQARKIDPYITQEPKYRSLLEEKAPLESTDVQALKTPLRVGAGFLVANALLGILFLILIFISGDLTGLGGGDIVAPLVNVVIAVNLWQLKEPWKRYTVWWAAIGLVLFGLGAIAGGDYFSLIIQAGFSGSLMLLLAGTPSKARTVAAVLVFLVLYLGPICILFSLILLGAVAGTG
jgi:hypothetical protein